MWSNKALGVSDFTATLKFRIHGQVRGVFAVILNCGYDSNATDSGKKI